MNGDDGVLGCAAVLAMIVVSFFVCMAIMAVWAFTTFEDDVCSHDRIVCVGEPTPEAR